MVLHLKNISLAFGGQEVFCNLSWHLRRRDRMALVGPNGSGKTTLMRLICGEIQPDRGEIAYPKGTRFGYLPQEGLVHTGRSLFEEVRCGCTELVAMEAEMERLEQELEGAEDGKDEALLRRYGELQEQFIARGGFRLEAEVGAVLRGLGFGVEEWEQPVESFSGGWQMRIALARLLVQKPDVLLLDEPTNHLDIEARNWLEGYLGDYPGAVVIVSHDRYFLDVTVRRCVELFRGQLMEYEGNLSAMEEERRRRWEAYEAAYRRQQEERDRIERFINKFRYKASKAAQVQSRLRMLETMEWLEPPPVMTPRIRFTLPETPRSGRIVLRAEGLKKSFGSLKVLQGVDLQLLRGEKVALVGRNGAGKTTLLKILAGVLAADEGRVELGLNVLVQHFAQDQGEGLEPGRSILETVAAEAPAEMMPRLRNLLGGFLFSGDAVDKPIGVLSGGEKNRVALARMLLRRSNLLLLDEPTNHLDLASKEVLLEALQRYRGTVLFVSHDRHFVDVLAEKVLELEGGRLTEYLGNYEDYLAKKAEAAGELEREQDLRWRTGTPTSHRPRSPTPSKTSSSFQPPRREQSLSRRRLYRERQREERRLQARRRKLAERIEAVQREIEEREAELAALEERMAAPGFYEEPNVSRQAVARHKELLFMIQRLYNDWEQLEARAAWLDSPSGTEEPSIPQRAERETRR